MKKILEFLDGKKTIIGAAILFLGYGAKGIEIINDDQLNIIKAIGGFITVYGIRMAFEKIIKARKK
jgi:hypothetical protein